MALIIVPHVRAAQPQDRTGLNFAHPAFASARPKLAFNAGCGALVDVEGRSFTRNGTVTEQFHASARMIASQSQNNYSVLPYNASPATAVFTVIYGGVVNSLTNQASMLSSSQSSTAYVGVQASVGTNGATSLLYGNGGAIGPSSRRSFDSPSGIIATAQFFSLVWVITGATAGKLWLNGAAQTVTTSGTASGYNAGSTNGTLLHIISAGTETGNKALSHAIIIPGAIPDSIARSISENPWQLFTAPRRHLWTVPVSGFYSLVVESGPFSLSGQSSGLLATRRIASDQSSYSLVGRDVSFFYGKKMVADQATYALTGRDVATRATRRAVADQSLYTLNGQSAGLVSIRRIVAEHAIFSLSGQSVLTSVSRALTAANATYVLSGQDVVPRVARRLAADSGVYVLVGQGAVLRLARVISAEHGVYSLSGQGVSLVKALRIEAGHALYALNGQDVGLNKTGALTIVASRGTFTLTGQQTALLATRILQASSGTFGLTGQGVGFRRGFGMPAGHALYSLAGRDAILLPTRLLTAATASYVLNGRDIVLDTQKRLSANSGAYSYIGQDISFLLRKDIIAGLGTYLLLGNPIAEALKAGFGQYTLVGQNVSLIIAAAPVTDPSQWRMFDVPPEMRVYVIDAEQRQYDVGP